MNDGIEFGKWLATQGDRVWFLTAIVVLVWTFLKQQKRSESASDTKDAQILGMYQKLMEHSSEVTAVCAQTVDALDRNTDAFNKFKDKI